MLTVAAAKAQFEAAGQGHVTASLDSLPADEQAAFLVQLATIDPEKVNVLFQRAISQVPTDAGAFEPLQHMARLEGSGEERARWRARGLEEIAKGRVGVLLLAGGQGTRLGYDHPKGMYDIGLPSAKSLFQLQAERLLKVQALADGTGAAKIQWYVMTSPATDAETKAYFEAQKFFGLQPEQVFFFCQGMLPCISNEGKIMLQGKDSVAMAPDGNGGLYSALDISGALKHMADHGVEFVPQYCVDNALVKIADPVFVGYCAEEAADCAAKVINKTDPHEKVGVIILKDGQTSVVEYSELDKDTAEAQNEDGTLTYSACHLCINYFSRAFLVEAAATMVDKMPLHVAKKAIPFFDHDSATIITPTTPNGIKLELFIFDTFPFSKK